MVIENISKARCSPLPLSFTRSFYTRKSTHLLHFRSLLFSFTLATRSPAKIAISVIFSCHAAFPSTLQSFRTILLLLDIGFYISSRVRNSRPFYALKKKKSPSVSSPKRETTSFPSPTFFRSNNPAFLLESQQSNSPGKSTIRPKEVRAFSGTKRRSSKRLRSR